MTLSSKLKEMVERWVTLDIVAEMLDGNVCHDVCSVIVAGGQIRYETVISRDIVSRADYPEDRSILVCKCGFDYYNGQDLLAHLETVDHTEFE